MKDHDVALQLLIALLDGSTFASAMMPWGTPGPIRLPDDPELRTRLVQAHVEGDPATVVYAPVGRTPRPQLVPTLILIGLNPGADNLCRWVGVDLDAAGAHGAGGLIDPRHAARCIAERAANAGLFDGLIVARSRSAKGRHVWLVPPQPCPLNDAVLAVAQLAAWGFQIAERDTADGVAHAFRCADGTIARPGRSGAFELIPPSTSRPTRGWALALPCAGALAEHGGGVIVDPFEDRPVTCSEVPRCDPDAWSAFIAEANTARSKRRTSVALPKVRRRTISLDRHCDPLARIDNRTRLFLDGHAPEGSRNTSAFAASANLLGCGVDAAEADHLIMDGAAACGLPEREARAAFESAVRTSARTGRNR